MAKDFTTKSHTGVSYEDLDPGKYVIQLRESVGWSQAELARRIGIDTSDLSKVENNKRNPSGIWLILIYEAVQEEKDRLRRDTRFASEQEQRFYDNYVVKMLRDMQQLGMSDARIEGVRETMSGFIKSIFSV